MGGLEPRVAPDPERRWIVDRCPGCGNRRQMRDDQDLCGACQDGERMPLRQAMRPAMEVLVSAAVVSFGRAELLWLSDRLREAAEGEVDTS